MNTTDILEKTKKLVSKDREEKHGDKVENHENIDIKLEQLESLKEKNLHQT